LIDCLLEKIDILPLSQSGPLDVDGMEAMILLYKLHVNLGCPQRAWQCTRAAIDSAFVKGYHRLGKGHFREGLVWEALWQQDRHLSLFLGVPYSIQEQFIPEADEGTLQRQILRRLNIICGHVTDRDHLPQDKAFSKTVQITQEMEELEKVVPRQWGTALKEGSEPLGTPFWELAIMVLFHFTNQLIHMPYFKLADNNQKYAYNKSVALESAMQMLRTHRLMRRLEVPVVCDFLDFAVVGAALLLVIDIGRHPSDRSPNDTKQIWSQICSLRESLANVSDKMHCPVAGQAKSLLDHLTGVEPPGSAEDGDHYEVHVPIFGHLVVSEHDDKIEQSVHPDEDECQVPFPCVLDIRSNMFEFREPVEFSRPDELGAAWVDFDFSEVDPDFSWSDQFGLHEEPLV
jgi:hypothetical protein